MSVFSRSCRGKVFLKARRVLHDFDVSELHDFDVSELHDLDVSK